MDLRNKKTTNHFLSTSFNENDGKKWNHATHPHFKNTNIRAGDTPSPNICYSLNYLNY